MLQELTAPSDTTSKVMNSSSLIVRSLQTALLLALQYSQSQAIPRPHLRSQVRIKPPATPRKRGYFAFCILALFLGCILYSASTSAPSLPLTWRSVQPSPLAFVWSIYPFPSSHPASSSSTDSPSHFGRGGLGYRWTHLLFGLTHPSLLPDLSTWKWPTGFLPSCSQLLYLAFIMNGFVSLLLIIYMLFAIESA